MAKGDNPIVGRDDRDANKTLMPQPNKLPGVQPAQARDARVSLDMLPGSRKDGGTATVSNSTLMPKSGKLPGYQQQWSDSKAPAAHALGSGNKIPESQDTRMRSQFVTPDPLTFGKQKRQVDIPQSSGDWTTHEVRLSVPCSAYKSDYGDKKPADKSGEEGLTKSERQKLEGEKKYFLTKLSSGGVAYGDSQMYSILGVVSKINQKLGLPGNHVGSFRLPQPTDLSGAQRTKLMGEKEYLCSQLANPNMTRNDPECTRILGAVAQINQKLGLAAYNIGSWKLPDKY